MILISFKLLVIGFSMITLSGAAIATGILFASYNIGVSRNPEESDLMFNTTLMAFALIETFVFMSFLLIFLIILI